MYNCGLILADMGMRGVFTAGVLDIFLEENISFGSVYGVSTGCINGINYISRQKGRSFYNFINNHGSIYNGYHSGNVSAVLESGLMDGNDMPYMDSSEFDNGSYMNSNAKLDVVLTNTQTGEPEYLQITCPEREKAILNAANELSPVSLMPTTINGKKYINGLISDSIPIKKSIAAGNSKNIVIVTQTKNYFTNNSDYYDVAKIRYHKYPGMKSALNNSYNAFLNSYDFLQEEIKKGSAFVIAMPKELMLSNTDSSNRMAITEAYKCGRQMAKDNLDNLFEFLSDCENL